MMVSESQQQNASSSAKSSGPSSPGSLCLPTVSVSTLPAGLRTILAHPGRWSRVSCCRDPLVGLGIIPAASMLVDQDRGLFINSGKSTEEDWASGWRSHKEIAVGYYQPPCVTQLASGWENGELPWMGWNRAPKAHHPCPAHFTSATTGCLSWNVLSDNGQTEAVALGSLDLVDSPVGQMSNCWTLEHCNLKTCTAFGVSAGA
jgi:hypothetical protein